MKKLGLITVGLFLSFILACNSESSNNSNNQTEDSVNVSVDNSVKETLTDSTEAETVGNTGNNQLNEEYTAKYICPNHDKGSGSDSPGDCPVCGMELIENPNYQAK